MIHKLLYNPDYEDIAIMNHLSLHSSFQFQTSSVSIIIPAYNEEERITPVLDEIVSFIRENGLDWHIVISIDGEDKTEQIVRNIFDEEVNADVIVNKKRTGKGNAIKRAIEYASGDYIILMDADGSIMLKDVADHFGLTSQYDLVNFNRYLDVSNEIPYYRRFFSRAFNFMARGFLGIRIYDTQCGYKIARRQALMELFKKVTISNAFFDVFILYYAKRSGFRTVEVPIKYSHGEGSTFNVLKLIFSGIISLAAIMVRNSPLWRYIPKKVEELYYDKFSEF